MYYCYILLLTILLVQGNQHNSPSCNASKDDTPANINFDSVNPRDLYGEYHGRTPCKAVAIELGIPHSPECTKKKVFLYLLHDTITGQPTTYRLGGIGDKFAGKWNKVKGIPTDPQAIVYELKLPGRSLFLLEGDRNVLFLLDKDRNFLKGDADYSYTLNRIIKSISWDAWGDVVNKGLSPED